MTNGSITDRYTLYTLIVRVLHALYWKLVVRTNAFQFVWEKESQIIDSYSKGLKVESITVLEDKMGSEIVLNPLPLENGQDLHVLATNFCGEFYVKFYVRRSYSSWDLELDSFDYIYK